MEQTGGIYRFNTHYCAPRKREEGLALAPIMSTPRNTDPNQRGGVDTGVEKVRSEKSGFPRREAEEREPEGSPPPRDPWKAGGR